MVQAFIFFTALLFSSLLLPAQPEVAAGRVVRFENFPSQHTQARAVDVWLPANYDGKQKFAVLYLHDGQMLFDSTTTWNWQEWGVDETMSGLLKRKAVRNTIVVGVWNNGGQRHADYFPQKALTFLPPSRRDSVVAQELSGKPAADAYLRFLITELKPFVDSAFATHKDRRNTFIGGSSMGGLISLYAVCEYPEVFGGAACLSTHWPGSLKVFNDTVPSALLAYFAQRLPTSNNHRLYFDYGTASLDSYYQPYQQRMDSLLKRKGYTQKNWMTRAFAGEDHSERAWRKRLHLPLLFLLRP